MAAFGSTGRAALLASVIAFASVSTAHAQTAVWNVSFNDAASAFTQTQRPGPPLSVTASDAAAGRFADLETPPDQSATTDQADLGGQRQIELELHAPGAVTGPLDVSIAQRASFGADVNGDVNRRGRGSEVRVGHVLGFAHQRSNADPSSHRIYAFAASDDQALTWAPGSSHFALQDQVQVGDHQAGITYERGSVQASLAYVEREISTTVGRQSFSKSENFAGFTLTMRH